MRTLFLALLAPLALSACITKQSFESLPVEVNTPDGVVTCQFYGKNQTLFDRATMRPPSISDEKANAYCRAQGEIIAAE